jgi:hypothetical protein
MTMVCLEMEGVLRLEDWIAVAGKVGRLDFERTTRYEMGRFVEVIVL